MNNRLALQRLWWKELRQLMPIVTLLPMLVALLLGFHWLTGSGVSRPLFSSTTVVLCLGMPGLFACGAGALLVGYEKELRTLDWLSSLPIAAHRIVRVKVLAALVCLLVLWLLGFILFTVASGSSAHLFTGDVPAEWSWLFNSLFVLLAGFALAWWARSALVALLLVVPVATLPFVVAYAIDNWLWQVSTYPNPSTPTVLACQVVGIGLAWWLTERLGRRALTPKSTRPPLAAWLPAANRDRSGAWRLADTRIQSPMPALLWQFARQSRAVLWGTAIMLAVAITLLATTSNLSNRGGHMSLSLALVLAFLATSWLGVTTFQSDALSGRIRFLSDRGISARAIWLTRQAVPISLLALSALLFLAISMFATEVGLQNLDEAGLAIGIYLFMAIMIYLSSQWLGQVVFSPIVSAIAAPPVALAAISYGSFAIGMLGTPWWLALLVLPIPAIATRAMTRRWMDRRLGFSYWGSHAGFLAAVCLLPAVPLLIAVVRQPAMPDQVAQELQEVIQESRSYLVGTHELVLGNQERQAGSDETMAENLDRELDHIHAQLETTNAPIGASSTRVIEFLRSTAALARMSLDQATSLRPELVQQSESPDSAGGESKDQASLRHYRRAIGLLVQITQRMRLSPQLIDQDTADLIEIWLLSELARDQAEERLGQSAYEATARMLSDRRARREARMRAVALSWHDFQTTTREAMPTSLGGYQANRLQEDLGSLKGSWIMERRVGMAVADLWELARDGSDAATSERFSRIAEFWGHPKGSYGAGPQGPYLRADDLDRFLHPPLSHFRRAIASQWYADWERLAAQRLTEQ